MSLIFFSCGRKCVNAKSACGARSARDVPASPATFWQRACCCRRRGGSWVWRWRGRRCSSSWRMARRRCRGCSRSSSIGCRSPIRPPWPCSLPSFFGAVPLFRGDAFAATLNDGGRGNTSSRSRHRARRVLMAGQVALAFVLLIASGLMVRSFQKMRNVDPGFNPASVMTLNVALPASAYRSRDMAFNAQQESSIASHAARCRVGRVIDVSPVLAWWVREHRFSFRIARPTRKWCRRPRSGRRSAGASSKRWDTAVARQNADAR